MSVTAAAVLDEARTRHGDDLDAELLGQTYEAMVAMAERKAGGIFYTPKPVAQFITTFALEQAVRQIPGDDPSRVLRVVACDPSCGCGVFLVQAARLLATNYAGRLFGGQSNEAQVFAVMPTVVMWSIFGIDIDPVAVELARHAVSLETGGTLPPEALERHIVCGNPLDGDSPPAMEERLGNQPPPTRENPEERSRA
jgi:type I restriction-modification system DNA methylase subunit